LGGVRAAAFHSGLEQETKLKVQESFHRGELQAVVATVAFGMGIDKPDVRRVIHFGLPASLEAYVQESGRAGRDGMAAHCTILFVPADRNRREAAILADGVVPGPGPHRAVSRLQQAFNYARNRTRCRRAVLLEYLGEEPCDPGGATSSQVRPPAGAPGFCAKLPPNGTICCHWCDVCCSPCKSTATDMPCELDALLKCVASRSDHGGTSRTQLVDAMHINNPGSGLTKGEWLRVIDAAAGAGYVDLICSANHNVILYVLSDRGKLHLRGTHNDAVAFHVDLGRRTPVPQAESGHGRHRFRDSMDCVRSDTNFGTPARKLFKLLQDLSRGALSAYVLEQVLQRILAKRPTTTDSFRSAVSDLASVRWSDEQIRPLIEACDSLGNPHDRVSDEQVRPLTEASDRLGDPHDRAWFSSVVRWHTDEHDTTACGAAVKVPSLRRQATSAGDDFRPIRRLRRSGSSGTPPEAPTRESCESSTGPDPVVWSPAPGGSGPTRACSTGAAGILRQPAHARNSHCITEGGFAMGLHSYGAVSSEASGTSVFSALTGGTSSRASRVPIPSDVERHPVLGQQSSGGPALQRPGSRRKGRTRIYPEAERLSAPPFVAKLMEAAEFNSNLAGGSAKFKKLLHEARIAAPLEIHHELNKVQQTFKANTPGIHRSKLDEIIGRFLRTPGHCGGPTGGGEIVLRPG